MGFGKILIATLQKKLVTRRTLAILLTNTSLYLIGYKLFASKFFLSTNYTIGGSENDLRVDGIYRPGCCGSVYCQVDHKCLNINRLL